MSRSAGRLDSISDQKRIEAADASARGERSEWWVRWWPRDTPAPEGWRIAAQGLTHHSRWSVLIEPTEANIAATANLRKARRGRKASD